MSGLFGKAASGLKWTSLSSVGITLSQFTLGILLARLLSPHEFGLVAMVTVIIAYANVLVNFGFGTVLVQQKEISEQQFSGVFWINLILSLCIFLLFLLLAGRLAIFYDQSIIQSLTYWLAPIVLINALGICHKAKLEREINLKPVAVADMISVIGSTVVAIIMALKGYGVWSLVAQALLKAALNNAILFFSTRWLPALSLNMRAVRPMFRFSGLILANQLAEGASGNIDRLIVGKYSGSEELGAYEKAKNFMLLPTMMVGGMVSRVLLPTMSSIQDDLPRYNRHYHELLALVAFLVFPMIGGMQVLSQDFIPFLFGDQWNPMIPIFQIICWAGLFTVMNIMTDNIIISSGNQKGLLQVTILEKPFMFIILCLGIFWGVKGVALAYVIGAGLIFFLKSYIATRPLKLSVFSLIKPLSVPFLCSGVMYIGVSYLATNLILMQSAGWRLILLITSGIVIYGLLSLVLQKKNVNYFTRIIRQFGQ